MDPHKRPKTLKKRPKTPKNAPKRPKTPQNAPKTPQNAPNTPVFWRLFFQFSSVQVSFFRSGQFRSFQVSSGQVPDLIGRSGQFSSGESHLSSGRWFFQVRSVQVISGQFRSSTGRSGQFSSGESHLSGGPCQD